MAQVRKWHKLSTEETEQLFSLMAVHPEYHTTHTAIFMCFDTDHEPCAVVAAPIFANFIKYRAAH